MELRKKTSTIEVLKSGNFTVVVNTTLNCKEVHFLKGKVITKNDRIDPYNSSKNLDTMYYPSFNGVAPEHLIVKALVKALGGEVVEL